MIFQINNQHIEIKNGKTFITISYDNGCKQHDHKFNFDLRNFPDVEAEMRIKDYASYWWLGTLYNSMVLKFRGKQLKLEL